MSKKDIIELTKLAEQGDIEAQFKLAVAYDFGKNGVEQDIDLAIEWYTKAAEQGHIIAQHNLGTTYSDGCCSKCSKKAVYWYRKAAEQGCTKSCFTLGEMYFYGDGTKQNTKTALKWFSKAAAGGHVYAMEMVDKISGDDEGYSSVTASQLYCWLKNFLDLYELNYVEDEDSPCIYTGFSLDCNLEDLNMAISCYDGYFAIEAFTDLDIDESNRQNVMEFITRVNHNIRYGHFVLDLHNDEVYYRQTVDCHDRYTIAKDVFEEAIDSVIGSHELYGDGLLAVISGEQTPEEAMNMSFMNDD